jgi:pimeloyl-ACP methyl ester carboxylesterase
MPPGLRAARVASAPDPAQVPARFAKMVALMESFRDILERAIPAIGAPTLVMVGDHDVMAVEHDAQLARLLPHAELAVMPGSRHGDLPGVFRTS